MEKLLIAEDERAIRTLLRQVLHARYELLFAESDEQALAMANGHSGTIDLLLTEFERPTLNGLNLALEIGMARPKIKFIFLADERTAPTTDTAPGTIVMKPFETSRLLAVIRAELTVPARR